MASACKSLRECERWRGEILREISRKVSKIQDGAYSFRFVCGFGVPEAYCFFCVGLCLRDALLLGFGVALGYCEQLVSRIMKYET